MRQILKNILNVLNLTATLYSLKKILDQIMIRSIPILLLRIK